MWRWTQTGNLFAPDGTLAGTGYSGHSEGVNNGALEAVHDVGPIPKGLWRIGPFFDDPGGKGPVVCHLTPLSGTDAHGRSGFMVHGDNAAANHTASEGCIVIPRPLREAIRDSGDSTLNVTA